MDRLIRTGAMAAENKPRDPLRRRKARLNATATRPVQEVKHDRRAVATARWVEHGPMKDIDITA